MGIRYTFSDDQRGSIAVYTAVLAMPLLLALTYAMDLKWAERNKNELKSTADFAVLAAVNNNAIRADEKERFAREFFEANYNGEGDAELTVDVEGSAVEMRVDAVFPSTITGAIGISEVNVSLTSRAELTTEQVICVLALNRTEKDAIKFQGRINFSAPTCSVYSNSTSPMAIRSIGNAAPQAKGFCAAGGVRGSFLPYANSQCRQIPDPYAATFAPAYGNCPNAPDTIHVNDLPVAEGRNDNDGNDDDDDDDDDDGPLATEAEVLNPGTMPGLEGFPGQVQMPDGRVITVELDDSPNLVPSGTTLYPGTYCGGLTIAGDDVTLSPGAYYMRNGPFIVKDESTVTGSEVIIAMGGTNSVFRIENEGSLELSAPKVGAHKGLVIMQDTRNPIPIRSDGRRPVSNIMSGGELSVTGTVYLPEHELSVTGNGSRVGARAPSTSFIADTVEFKGRGNVTVAVDHEAAGLPPVLPRSEDGARLTR